jgi:hypothetical protein
MKYKKGQSGNEAGRPRGIPDRRTALRELLQPHAEALVNKAVELAQAGDTTALRICIDRLIPPVKARDESVDLGPLGESLAEQGKTVLEALAAGAITPDQAATMMSAIAAQARIVEVDELEKRVAALEETHETHQTNRKA